MKDLSTVTGTITNRVESLISEMEKMEFADIKVAFQEILIDEETSISRETCNKWMNAIDRKRNKVDLMMMITNLYLAGCDLKSVK